MSLPPFPRAWCAASAATILLPLLATAHPGHDHTDIPSVIRHPLVGADHVMIIAALLCVVGAVMFVLTTRRASIDHGARPRTLRPR
jgi:hydrogenase/urease accessory protein HupE